MLKKVLSIATILLMVLLFGTACGDSGSQESAGAGDEPAATEVSPYAWLGLEDMPQCEYLDILATNHYIEKDETYEMGFTVEETQAVDGINTYTENSSMRTWSIGGKILTVNEDSKIYMESDASGVAADAQKNLDEAMANGTNYLGRAFVEKGSGTIPEYENSGDTAEYEYYEYNYPKTEEATGNSVVERYYMKDGDVFAVYTKTTMGETSMEATKVIKSISEDIPDGTFDLPDLDGYEKYE